MPRRQFNLKTLLWLVVAAAALAAAANGSLLAIVLVYWGPAFLWARRHGRITSPQRRPGLADAH